MARPRSIYRRPRRMRPGRVIAMAVVAAVVVVVLFRWVFPWVEQRHQDPTLGAAQTTIVVQPWIDR